MRGHQEDNFGMKLKARISQMTSAIGAEARHVRSVTITPEPRPIDRRSLSRTKYATLKIISARPPVQVKSQPSTMA